MLVLRCLCAALCRRRRGHWFWGRRFFFRSATAGFLLRRQNQVKRIAFLSGAEFHQALVFHVFNQAFQDLPSQTLPRHFASAEEDGRFDLVAFVEEAEHVILLRIVIMVVHVDTELHFFDRNGLLFLFGFAFALFVLVQEFPV